MIRRTAFALAIVFAAAGPALAQLPAARLNGVHPCGAQRGTSVRCVISGADLEGASGLYFSHRGIVAKPIDATNYDVSVAGDVPPGVYDVRVVANRGLSNFRAFVVGDRAEVVEAEPNDDPEKAQKIKLPAIVNGRIDKPTDVDEYRFPLRRGQRVLIECRAWRIDSPLDATLLVFDPRGKETAYHGDYAGKDPLVDFTAAEDGDYTVKLWDFVYGGGADFVYRLHVDSLPHLDAAVPAALRPGERTKVTFYGRNLPGGVAAPDGLKIGGRGLETITREVELPKATQVPLRTGEAVRPSQAALDGFGFRLEGEKGASNPIFLGAADDAVVVEREPNDRRAEPQKVAVPCEITGMFARPGDVDCYSFALKKGDSAVVEIIGERQSGTIDPFLTGYAPGGRRAFTSDDDAIRNIGQLRFATQTRDARWNINATVDGDYVVQVRDLYYQQRGEARFVYRLSVRRPRLDFRLQAVPTHDVQPDSTTVTRGGRNWIDVLAFRNDGFDGAIEVEATGLPPGVTCDPIVIGPGKTSAPLVLRAANDAPIGHADIVVTGRAKIDGRDVVHQARGGGLTWPTVNTPGIARSSDSIPIAVRPAAPFAIAAEPRRRAAKPGETIAIDVTIDRAKDWTGGVQLAGFDLPQGVSVALVNVAPNATKAKVNVALPANLKPGSYTFTVNGAGQAPRDYLAGGDPAKPRGRNMRVVFPSDSITIDVAPPAAR